MLIAVGVSGCADFYPSPIISGYGSTVGADGRPRRMPHAGVDFWARHGSTVLAAADGVVISVRESPRGCGIGVLISHERFNRYTVYCHLSKAFVDAGQAVKRGEVIGLVGITGNATGIHHVHLELCTVPCYAGHDDGDFQGTESPSVVSVGCFDPHAIYPDDRLVLTYPVACEKGEG